MYQLLYIIHINSSCRIDIPMLQVTDLYDTSRIVCGRVYVTIRCPSVCLSVDPSFCPIYRPLQLCSSVRRVCCCGPRRQAMSIDCSRRGRLSIHICSGAAGHHHVGHQQLRAVLVCQLTREAEHRLVVFAKKNHCYVM